MRHFLQPSYRRRLLVSYVSFIVILPLVGFATYSAGIRFSNDEIESYARETTQLIASAITRQCAAAEQEVWYSESLNTFLSEYITNVHNATSDSQIALQRAAMRNTLYSMMYNNQAFQAVYYVGNDLNTVSCQRGTFAAGYDVLAAIDYQAELESVLELDGQVVWESLDDHFVVMKKLVYDINTLSAIGCIGVVIDRSYFSQTYDTGKLQYAMLDDGGEVLFFESAAAKEIVQAYLQLEGRAEEVLRYGGVSYRCFYMTDKLWQSDMVYAINLQYASNARGLFSLVTLLGMILAAALALLMSIFFSQRNAKRVIKLLNGIERIGKGDFDTTITMEREDELQQIALRVNDMARHIRKLMQDLVAEQQAKRMTEYQALEYRYYALQCQIHPHLLFNTLESINGIAKMRGDFQSSQLICQLASLLRQTLQETHTYSLVSDEISYIRKYLGFYREIYGKRLKVKYFVDKSVENAVIPSFIMLPIIENSIVHGVEKMTGEFKLHIACFSEEETLFLRIEDNGPGFDPEQKQKQNAAGDREGHRSIGLESVRERLNLLYPGQAAFTVHSERGKGAVVEITLPYTLGGGSRPGKEDEA